MTALTWKVYAVPFIRPGTAATVSVGPTFTVLATVVVVPTKARTRYPVIPAVLAGGVQRTVADALPASPVTFVGTGASAARGVTAAVSADAGPVPTALTAATSKR